MQLPLRLTLMPDMTICIIVFTEMSLSSSRNAHRRMARPGLWTFGARSTAEGAVEERGEEVLGLTQRLPLHGTQALHSLNQGRKLLLEG